MPDNRTHQHRILMITTGGTIGGNVAHDDQSTTADKVVENFDQITEPTLALLSDQLNTEIYIESVELANIDSSDVDPSLWVQLTDLIASRYDEFDSFLITHGTNTLGYTCAALSFSIANSGKPIVLTGSQVPFGLPGSDALTNLENALRVCVGQGQGNTPISGVVAVFGSFIITGTRVKKNTEFDYDAFKSFGTGALGRIGRIINLNHPNLVKHNSYLATSRYPLATQRKHLRIDSGFDMNIVSLTEFPGMDPNIFEILVERKGVKGFILRAFGAGDPAASLRPAFEMLKGKRIPIVVTTQAPNGNANFQVNEPGQWLRDHDMAIPAFDMSIEAQTAKLAWLLYQESERRYTYSQICEKMQEDLRGEINVMWEIS
jgi:L-asparaginase